MSFFEDASLVLIPSAQKTSKVYSVKPTDGTGDLTFTRSNDTATRVGPDGLIEKVRTNVLLYSNTFSSWTLQNVTATSGQTGYDGTSNAWVLKGDTTSDRHNLNRSNAATGEHTISIYAKASGHSFFQLATAQTADQYANFNLTDGTVGTVGNDFSNGQITSVGSGWYRISVISKNGINTIYLSLVSSNTAGWLESWAMPNNTDGVLIMDGQLEANVLTPFIGNTTTSGVSVGPVANVPRLDYLNSSCPRLLLEPQRTNLAIYSENFDNVAWVKQNSIAVTANTATSPDGYTNADTLEKASGSGGSNYYYIVDNSTSDTTNTFSVFAKYKTGSGIIWLLGKNSGTFAYFNLQTGTALSASGGMTTKIENYGNGWYRCLFTQDYTGASEYTFGVGLCLADGTPNYDATSAATQGAYIYGAQFEAGAYATSYIPTLGAAVTRGADAASKTGISSLIGQTEGTIFVDVTGPSKDGDARYISVSNSVDTNRILLYAASLTTIGAYFQNPTAGAVQPTFNTVNGRMKIAIAYKNNDLAVYMNGTLQGTVSSYATAFTLNFVGIGTYEDGTIANSLGQGVSQALIFKTRLTNAQLAELTTL